MRTGFGSSVLLAMAFLAFSGAARGEPAASKSDVVLVRMPAGASVGQVQVSERAGVIRLFRVVAPRGTRVKVTGVIPGLAGVTIPIPRDPLINAETCSRHGGTVACVEGEEACPMPAATWRFLVRKVAGPAGRIRIEFVVGPQHSA
jgi:hypothetical protein